MKQQLEHLTNAQIEDYLSEVEEHPSVLTLRALESHLAQCDACRLRVLERARTHLGLKSSHVNVLPYAECPPESTLQELAAGIAAPASAGPALQHAANCDHCGPVLKKYLDEFAEELTPEETGILKQVQSKAPPWQKQLLQSRIVPSPEPPSGFFARLRSLVSANAIAFAGAATALVIAVGVATPVLWSRLELYREQRLVASVFAERRTTEMRLTSVPRADYQPLPIQKRSGDDPVGGYDRPLLLKAKSALADKLQSGNVEPQWLELEGRISLLEGTLRSVEKAEQALQQAQSKGLDSPSLQIDLAAAYFEHDIKRDPDRPVLIRTIDLLTKVLRDPKLTDQDRSVALFDLAIAYEKSEMLDLAASTWQEYLKVDSSSDWAAEARQRLSDLQKKIPPPRPQGYKQPTYFLAHFNEPEVEADLEEYREIGLSKWLFEAVRDSKSDSALAVERLAELLDQKYSDHWLKDFTKNLSPKDLPAVKSLAGAITDDENDFHRAAIEKSRKAAELFAERHNSAGELRARYQEVYGLQRSLAGDTCLSRVNQLWPRLSQTDYFWLQGQLALTKAVCANLTLDFDTAKTSLETARKVLADFPDLRLRVDGFEAGISRRQKDVRRGWQQAAAGLHQYWEKPASWERLFQFYSVMQQCAIDMGAHDGAEALFRQSIALFENNAPDDLSVTASLYLIHANLVQSLGDPQEAATDIAKAEALLREVPIDDPTAEAYAVTPTIQLAKFYLRRREANPALSAIDRVDKVVLKLDDDFVKVDFYTVKAEINFLLQRIDEAASDYEEGLRIADRSLSKLEDDQARLAWINSTNDVYRGMVRLLLARKEDNKALSVWELMQSRPFQAQRLTHASEPSIDHLGLYPPLPSRPETHLIYASFDDGLQIWATNGASVKSRWIDIKKGDLKHEVEEFIAECSDPRRTLDKADELYSLLIEPVLTTASATPTVAIELDQPLSQLPIEALQSSEGRYFGEQYSVIYSPGLLVEAALRNPVVFKNKDSLLFVDASRSEGETLPGVPLEAAAVKDHFPETTIMESSNLTAQQVIGALPAAVGFHFSGHGRSNGSGIELVLNPSSSLKSKDFSALPLRHVRLAILDACSSGFARDGNLDASNFVRSFLSGGVPNIIASHWDVDSRKTADLMRSFYGHLHSGDAPPQALHHAQAEMIAAGLHPYYWAAFNVSGRAN